MSLDIILIRKLKEVSKHWHQSLEDYNNIDDFIASINALIQAIRNITFIIQSNQASIPNFDIWYSKERELMKSDVVLRWLVEARNTIVKQKDLDFKSIAEITIKDWNEKVLSKFEVSALLSNDDIIELVMKNISNPVFIISASLMREPLLIIKRTWIVNDLQEYEILKATAYWFNYLKLLVIRTLEQSWFDISKIDLSIEFDNSILEEFIPIEKTSILIDLNQWWQLIFNHIKIPNEEMKEIALEATELYWDFPEILSWTNKNIFEIAKRFLTIAKRIIEVDWNHAPMVYYFLLNWELEEKVLLSDNKTQQYAQMELIASDIIRLWISWLIFIQESWMRDPSNFEIRWETLNITAIDSTGKMMMYFTPLQRIKNGEIIFSETEFITDLKDMNWLLPIRKAFWLI